MSRLADYYKSNVVDELMKQFNYSSVMEVPKITKITLNMGVVVVNNDSGEVVRAIKNIPQTAFHIDEHGFYTRTAKRASQITYLNNRFG